MSDSAFKEETQPKPPQGSEQKASEYITQITDLVNQDKLIVKHTDLSKHDPSNLQDHYRIELKEYMVEVSHSKDANTGRDSFVLLFTNLKNIRDGCSEKLILGYVHLTPQLFNQFKTAGVTQEARIKRQEEERLFNQNLQPINEALSEIASGKIITEPTPSIPESSTVLETAASQPMPVAENTQSTPIPAGQPTLSSIAQENPKPVSAPEPVPQAYTQPVAPSQPNMPTPITDPSAPKTPTSFPGM